MKVGILGAGMSGLSAAYLLHRQGVDVEILEAESYLGGFAHSFAWNGHTCDWAAHRLFTHDEHILQQIKALVPLRQLDRVSAVRLGGKWLKDPVDALQLCGRFFPRQTLSIPWTYATRPRRLPELSFQHYCLKKYGRRLERFLFSPYTEKMFGIPADRISVEWARKKVRLAGPLDVIRQGSKKKFHYFYYPESGGYGTICDALARPVRDRLRLQARAHALELEGGRVTGVRYTQGGQESVLRADHFISTIPLTQLCGMVGHQPPLTYRAVAAVYVLVNKPQTTPNHWIYYMDGGVVVNRLCEFKNLDPRSGPPETSVVCAEVTDCDRPDFLERAVDDLAASGIFRKDQVLDTTVVRREYSYPVYRCDYEKDVDLAQGHLARFANLHSIGRAAQFEHFEVDDCLEAALQLTRQLTEPVRAAVAEERRSPLPVEPRVVSVVADLGHVEQVRACVAALQASDYAQHRVLVVCSGESRLGEWQAALPGVTVLADRTERGLPAAYNTGLARAFRKEQADYVFLCRSSTTVAPDLLSQLVRVAQRDPEAGALMPAVLQADAPDRLWTIGLRFRRFPPATQNIGRGERPSRYPVIREVEYAAGCGLLVRREAVEKAGLFDPGYACYYEDVDFSRRVRDAGFRIRYVPEARLFHRPAPPGNPRAFHEAWGESFTRFYRRHMTPLALVLPLHVGYLLARESLTGNLRNVPALCRGIWRGLRRRLGPAPTLDQSDFLDA